MIFSLSSFSQEKLYGDFNLYQTKGEVKKIFKKNKKKYQNISFGGQDFWIINKLAISSFIYKRDRLIGIRLFSKRMQNLMIYKNNQLKI